MKEHSSELIKIASMYYEEGLTQAEIARQRGVSRPLISKYLNDARKEGIVEIRINTASNYTVGLERKLENKYGLKNAIVVDTLNLTENEIRRTVSQQAADYLSQHIHRYKTIGISWGKTLKRLVDNFPYINSQDTTIIPLVGGLSDDLFEIQSNQLANDLARKIRGRAKYIYAPGFINNSLIHNELLNNDAIQSVLNDGENVEFTLMGLSTLDLEDNMRRIGYINDEDIEILREQKAVGVMNSRFFDQEGEELKNEINANVIGLELDKIRKLPNVMTIVLGDQKTEALRIALQTNLINIIVTTNTIAEKLL